MSDWYSVLRWPTLKKKKISEYKIVIQSFMLHDSSYGLGFIGIIRIINLIKSSNKCMFEIRLKDQDGHQPSRIKSAKLLNGTT